MGIIRTDSAKNVILVGCGPYAQRTYIPSLNALRVYTEQQVHFLGVVELDSQVHATRAALKKWAIKASDIDVFGVDQTVSTCDTLNNIHRQHHIDGLIISTEPTAHLEYLQWAIANQVHVLIDKPITTRKNCSTDENEAWGILHDYNLIAEHITQVRNDGNDLACTVATQRRYNPQLQKLLGNVREIFEMTGQLPNTISIAKSDGRWRLPSELYSPMNHGFTDGYGILSHSGYHIFDTVAQILKVADGTDKEVSSVSVHASVTRPKDIEAQASMDCVQTLLEGSIGDKTNEDAFGEVDANILLECTCKNGAKIMINLQLLHHSLSQRTLHNITDENANGYTKYEHIRITQGPFAVHEYVNDHAKQLQYTETILAPAITPGKKLRRLRISGAYNWISTVTGVFNKIFGWKWKADFARLFMLKEFNNQLHGEGNSSQSASDVLTHHGGVQLFTAANASAARSFQGENPIVAINNYSTNYPNKPNL